MSKDTVCSAFWKHTNIRGDDRVFPCCRFKEPVTTYDGNIDNILSSQEYQNLRDLSSQGVKIKGCEKCYHEEQLGKESLRQKFNKEYDRESVALEYFEIGFDNVCNLTCDGCFDEFSNSWAKKNNPNIPLRELTTKTSPISKLPNTVKKIMFLGGEPLMSNRHRSLLKTIDNKHEVSVTYNTNGMFFVDQKTLDLLDEFKNVSFILSVDAYGALNDKVRSGSRWPNIIRFIDQILDLDYDLTVHTVIHMNNWFGLVDLSKFIRQYRLNWTVNVLTYPQHLDIINLDHQSKVDMINMLETIEIPNKDYIIEHLNLSKEKL